jgi:hypothetical protein
MENDLDDIQKMWQQAKLHQPGSGFGVEELIAQAKQKGKKIYSEHYGNLAVLGSTALILFVFFFILYSLQEVLTKFGIALMIGGLLVRIAIEMMSLMRAKKIELHQPTAHTLPALLAFHRLRKQIHGPVTIFIVVLYVIGLYSVTPEVGRYISSTYFIWMHISIPVIAVFLVAVGRNGINNEMRALEKLLEIQQRLRE